MGLGLSRRENDDVSVQLRERAKFIRDVQLYLLRVDKIITDSETAHKGVRQSVEIFFNTDSPFYEHVIGVAQSLKAFEHVRGDLKTHTQTAKKTSETLLTEARRLGKLVSERNNLSRRVTACTKKLEKLRVKSNLNSTPTLQKRIFKMQQKVDAVSAQYRLKNAETEQETKNTLSGKYAEAALLISQSAGIIVQYVQLLGPAMQKAERHILMLQQSAGEIPLALVSPATPLSPNSTQLGPQDTRASSSFLVPFAGKELPKNCTTKELEHPPQQRQCSPEGVGIFAQHQQQDESGTFSSFPRKLQKQPGQHNTFSELQRQQQSETQLRSGESQLQTQIHEQSEPLSKNTETNVGNSGIVGNKKFNPFEYDI